MAKRLNLGGRLRGKLVGGTEEKNLDELWPMVKEKFETGTELRRQFERQWILNLAFLAGKQYVFFSTAAHTIKQLKKIKGRIRNVDNILVRRWARQVSDLIASAPIMSVVPQTPDDQDIKAAKLGDRVIKAFWRNNHMRKKIRQLGGWVYACGNGFLDDRWNRGIGPTQVDKDGQLVYMGDADCGVLSPFELLVPFTAFGQTEVHEFPWIMKARFKSLEYITENWKRGKEVEAETIAQPAIDVTALMGQFSGDSPSKNPGAMVLELYVKPNSTYKKGLYVIAANGIVLYKDDWALDHYHIEQFKDIDVPGMFWGKAILEDAIPLQKTWNRTISSIDEFNRIVAKGKGLTPRGAKLDTLPDDQHGEWIEYTPVLGHKPEFMTHKGLPTTLTESLDRTMHSLDNLYSQHEVSRGTNRHDLRSGEMARFLREQDARGNLGTFAVFEESLEAVMNRVLRRIRDGYEDSRMLQIRGDQGDFEVFAFKGADLKNNTDVSVKRDSSIPDSRLAREARIKENFEKGLYGDPADPRVRRRVLTMLDDAETKDAFNELRLDETYARWENSAILQSQAEAELLVNEYDNHAIHLEEHGKFRKTLSYQKLKLENPELFNLLEAAFQNHCAYHQKFNAQQMEAEMAARAKYEAQVKQAGGGGEA